MTFKIIRIQNSYKIYLNFFYIYIPYVICYTYIDCFNAITCVGKAYKHKKAIVYDPDGSNKKIVIKYDNDEGFLYNSI